MAKINKVSVNEEGNLSVDLEITPEEIFERIGLYPSEYRIADDVRKEVEKKISEKIMSESGKEIIEEVLAGVNWPEIVRSKIARRVIAEAGKENYY